MESMNKLPLTDTGNFEYGSKGIEGTFFWKGDRHYPSFLNDGAERTYGVCGFAVPLGGWAYTCFCILIHAIALVFTSIAVGFTFGNDSAVAVPALYKTWATLTVVCEACAIVLTFLLSAYFNYQVAYGFFNTIVLSLFMTALGSISFIFFFLASSDYETQTTKDLYFVAIIMQTVAFANVLSNGIAGASRMRS